MLLLADPGKTRCCSTNTIIMISFNNCQSPDLPIPTSPTNKIWICTIFGWSVATLAQLGWQQCYSGFWRGSCHQNQTQPDQTFSPKSFFTQTFILIIFFFFFTKKNYLKKNCFCANKHKFHQKTFFHQKNVLPKKLFYYKN